MQMIQKYGGKFLDFKDVGLLQKDIDYLHEWSINNKMNFHPKNVGWYPVNSELHYQYHYGILLYVCTSYYYKLLCVYNVDMEYIGFSDVTKLQ